MIKYLTIALVLLAVVTSTAQAVRSDTTTLGIYNTGARFILTRADFGTQTATDILADMVIAYDTVEIATTISDTGRTSRVRRSYEKRCNSISGLAQNKTLFKDKIVLMALNKDCDVTQLCLLAQRSGAKAFVFVHNSNSNGNIHLPNRGAYPDSIRIPVFVVGNDQKGCIQRARFAIQQRKLFTGGCKSHMNAAGDFAGVERVQRLPELQHHVIGDIH